MYKSNLSQNLEESLKFFSLLLLFLLISLIPCMVSNHNQREKADRERREVSTKVLSIMRMYNCNNSDIYEAIMSTFDPVLVAVVIAVESEYQVDAVSRAGCRGLMQLSPDKLEDWKDVRQNIRIGSAYLESQLKRFGKLDLAFAAYNAGPESVLKYRGVPPFRETIAYIEKAKRFKWAINDSFDQTSPLAGSKQVRAFL